MQFIYHTFDVFHPQIHTRDSQPAGGFAGAAAFAGGTPTAGVWTFYVVELYRKLTANCLSYSTRRGLRFSSLFDAAGVVTSAKIICGKFDSSKCLKLLRPVTRARYGRTWPSAFLLRVCARTSAGQKAYFEPNDPHPDPLPSDGRGNSLIGLLHVLHRLDTPTDGARFSLSHPMGEGRGEGECASKSEIVFARVLNTKPRCGPWPGARRRRAATQLAKMRSISSESFFKPSGLSAPGCSAMPQPV